MFFLKIWLSSGALFVDVRKATAYGRLTQTIPVGETAFLLAAPKEQPPRKLSGKRTAGG